MNTFSTTFFQQVSLIAEKIDTEIIESMVDQLVELRNRSGRLFIIGVGGSAANCSHAVNDFRKLCKIEAYAPTDNVSELTARINDDGWEGCFSSWLKGSNICEKDMLLVLSVGGGDKENNVSVNIINAIDEAKRSGMKVLGIVGRNGGYTSQVGDHVLIVPTVDQNLITPLSESFQAVVWHSIVSHPKLQLVTAKWEEVSEPSYAQ